MKEPFGDGVACALPHDDESVVQLAHGSGGRKTARLVEGLLAPALQRAARASGALEQLQCDPLAVLGDGAQLRVGDERLAFTTDSFVVSPRFFPGGDIGSLAVYGTVNDLAMCGADPLVLSLALVLEEGLPMAELRAIVDSIAAASERVGVAIVTGDTKVVDRGKGDGVYINTTGIGRVRRGIDVRPDRCRVGDRVLVSGSIGEHGIAVMVARHGLALDGAPVSDAGPVVALVQRLLDVVPETRVLRDPTRGGVATALCEIAAASRIDIRLEEAAIPVRAEVRGVCELLGLDPLYVACEGRFLAVVPRESVDDALAALRSFPEGADACCVGEVTAVSAGRVRLRTPLGSERRLERLAGDPLPRIC